MYSNTDIDMDRRTDLAGRFASRLRPDVTPLDQLTRNVKKMDSRIDSLGNTVQQLDIDLDVLEKTAQNLNSQMDDLYKEAVQREESFQEQRNEFEKKVGEKLETFQSQQESSESKLEEIVESQKERIQSVTIALICLFVCYLRIRACFKFMLRPYAKTKLSFALYAFGIWLSLVSLVFNYLLIIRHVLPSLKNKTLPFSAIQKLIRNNMYLSAFSLIVSFWFNVIKFLENKDNQIQGIKFAVVTGIIVLICLWIFISLFISKTLNISKLFDFSDLLML